VPVGIEFLGPPFSEPRLLQITYGFEQATHARKPPQSTPPLNYIEVRN
jgi:amidase